MLLIFSGYYISKIMAVIAQFTRRAQASHSTHKIRSAITNSQLKFSLCKLLLLNSSQYSCHAVAVASAANFPGISKQITEQYHDFAQS